MDCFKSGRESPADAGVEAMLAGRLPVDGWLLPKKSNPSNESAGFVCLGGAG